MHTHVTTGVIPEHSSSNGVPVVCISIYRHSTLAILANYENKYSSWLCAVAAVAVAAVSAAQGAWLETLRKLIGLEWRCTRQPPFRRPLRTLRGLYVVSSSSESEDGKHTKTDQLE